jgi:hypothetical protein
MPWTEPKLLLSLLNKTNWIILTKGRRRHYFPPNPPLCLREVYRGCGRIEASLQNKNKMLSLKK